MMRVKRSFREDEVVEVIMTRSLAIFKDFLLSKPLFLLKNMSLMTVIFTENLAGKLDLFMYDTESYVF